MKQSNARDRRRSALSLGEKSERIFMELNRLVLLSLSFVLVSQIGFCREDSFIRMPKTMNLLGGVRDCGGIQNSAEIESIARFAVQEHNKNQVFLCFIYFFNLYWSVVCLVVEKIQEGNRNIFYFLFFGFCSLLTCGVRFRVLCVCVCSDMRF